MSSIYIDGVDYFQEDFVISSGKYNLPEEDLWSYDAKLGIEEEDYDTSICNQ